MIRFPLLITLLIIFTMSDYVIGQQVFIRLWATGEDPIVAGCNTSSTLQVNNDFIELTPIGGRWLEFLPTYKSATASFDSVVFFSLPEEGRADTQQQLSWVINQTLLNFRITWQGDTAIAGYEGSCYLRGISITGAVNNYATGQIQLQITGELVPYEDS